MQLPEYHKRRTFSPRQLNDLRVTMSRALSRDRVLWSPEDLHIYAFDASKVSVLPDLVVRPTSTTEVAAVLRYADRSVLPVYPRGAGTGLTGGSVPTLGGIVMDLSLMNRILEINEFDLFAVAQAGVIVEDLQKTVEDRGLFYPPDPASSMMSTLGGNVAENAGGLRAVKYGVTRDYVLALEAVLPDGLVLRLGARTVKNVTGYDVMTLLVGSEGTLAVITEITVRLIAAPEVVLTVLGAFRTHREALAAAATLIRNRILPRACEFVDHRCIDIAREQTQVDLPAQTGAVLVVETDGPAAAAAAELDDVIRVLRDGGAFAITRARDEDERQRLWDFRRALSPSLLGRCPRRINEDVCVPRSRLVDMLEAIEETSRRTGIEIANYGHAGDGNIHVNLLPKDDHEERRAHEAAGDILREAVQLGGTLSGEHGIGFTKQDFLSLEIAPDALSLMRKLKNLFDPNNILNPLKIFPPEGSR